MDTMPPARLGDLIKKYRGLKGWTQENLMEASRVDTRTIQRLENGETKSPRKETLKQLANALNVQEELLLEAARLDRSIENQKTYSSIQDETLSNSPQPEDEQKKRKDNSEEPIPGDGEESNRNDEPISTSSGHIQQQHIFHRLQQYSKRKYWKLSTIVTVLVLLVISASGFLLFFRTNGQQAPFQGAWVSPSRGAIVNDVIHFAAYAAPDNFADPKINQIIFTAWWQGVDPHHWMNLCYAYNPDHQGIFRCETNLRQFGALAGSIVVSFDIYSKNGSVRSSPDGEFTIHYLPSPPSS
jgi:transcriptional regulator with XRE-family HTH domain